MRGAHDSTDDRYGPTARTRGRDHLTLWNRLIIRNGLT